MFKWRHKRGLKRIWEAYGDYIKKASLNFGVPRELILAVIWRESRGHPDSVRGEPRIGDASYGLMQILCSTARDMGFRGACYELTDPEKNIWLGTAYLAWLKNHGLPTWALVVAAYNCGPGRVRRLCRYYGYSIRAIWPYLPKTTRSYLKEVFGKDFKGGTLKIAEEVICENP